MKLTLTLLTALLLMPLAALYAADAPKLNVLLIVADDLGYGDVGCYGSTKIKTPNIDQLAREGVRFTDAHAPAAVCQPSRYAILSGTYLLRAKPHGNYQLYFHEGQVTLPGLLQAAGYHTACIGKWHNGFGRGAEPEWNGELKPGPLEIGFDSFFGTPRTHNEPPFVFVENHRVVGVDPLDPIRMISHAEVVKRGLKDWGWGISEGGKAAHAARPDDQIDLIYAEKAIHFITQNKDHPFFLYLAFQAPHVPITPSPAFRGTSQAGIYGDYIQQMDACIGDVLEALRAQGLADNTLVFMTSDNGGLLLGETLKEGHRANGSFLGQKTDGWEGGHRIPFIARWPGRIPAGTHCDHLLCLTDLMATITAAAKVPLPAGAAPDSLNQLTVLTEPATAPVIRTELLAQGTGGYALRQGDWVYLPKQGSCGMTVQVPPATPWGQPYAKMGFTNSDVDAQGKIKPGAPPAQLYNLRDDLQQTTNRFSSEAEIAKRLGTRLEELVPKPSPERK